jgi:uncharacterized protein YyaL (SSP411 family)
LRDAVGVVVSAFVARSSSLVLRLAIAAACVSTIACDRSSDSPSPVTADSKPAQRAAAAVPVRDWVAPEAAPGGEPYGDELRGRLTAALNLKPAGYEPRTFHLRPDGSPLYTNRLVLETSPYLLQHAHNPVDWRPWGDEAFATARKLGRPVLLSVGYSTCHWCHVMERESFEDLEIATYINANYVAIKVDREELPDVDAVYMSVLQMLTGGGGGWPMTVVLTADRQPLFAGTYFPARDGDRGTGTGLLTVLTSLRDRFAREGDAMANEAAALSKRLQAASAPRPPGDLPTSRAIEKAARELSASFDTLFGGFGRAPKFPRSVTLDLLLRYHRRTKDPDALHIVVYTLERMAAGGMRDRIGGGFHRYATDARWLVPHFEKMLYDNALLAVSYLEGYQVSGRRDFLAVAVETLDYVAREMTDPAGGFYSATDADSAGPAGVDEEGRFFTWTPAEVREVVAREDVDLVLQAYGITEGGNFENGRSVVHAASGVDVVARKLGVPLDAATRRLEAARAALYRARAARPAPPRDEKIIAAWNGLMISAFARGALIAGDADYTESARDAGAFVVDRMIDSDGRLARVWKDGQVRHAGVLDDYAFVIAGLLDLFEASAEPRWLESAVRLQKRLEADFADPAGGYFLTPKDREALLLRLKPDYDSALPAGNSVAALNLLRLAELTGEDGYRASAEKVLRAFARPLTERPSSLPRMLCALDWYLDKPKEIVIVLPDYETEVSRFVRRLGEIFLPNRTLVVAGHGEHAKRIAALVPLAAGKEIVEDVTTAYVCENRVCKKPTSDPEEFARQLAPVTPYP